MKNNAAGGGSGTRQRNGSPVNSALHLLCDVTGLLLSGFDTREGGEVQSTPGGLPGKAGATVIKDNVNRLSSTIGH